MSGELLRTQLTALALHFDDLAVPTDGRYVRSQAFADESGITSVPPPVPDPFTKLAAGVLVGGVAAAIAISLRPRRRQRHWW
jgi:hypothetical protein